MKSSRVYAGVKLERKRFHCKEKHMTQKGIRGITIIVVTSTSGKSIRWKEWISLQRKETGEAHDCGTVQSTIILHVLHVRADHADQGKQFLLLSSCSLPHSPPPWLWESTSKSLQMGSWDWTNIWWWTAQLVCFTQSLAVSLYWSCDQRARLHFCLKSSWCLQTSIPCPFGLSLLGPESSWGSWCFWLQPSNSPSTWNTLPYSRRISLPPSLALSTSMMASKAWFNCGKIQQLPAMAPESQGHNMEVKMRLPNF